MRKYHEIPHNRTDSGRFEDATLEQLRLVYDGVGTLNSFMLNPYLEWADGKRAWMYGNDYAADGFRCE